MHERRTCALCGSGRGGRLHPISHEPWHVVECADCGFVYLENPPAYEELEDDLAWEKLFEADRARRHPGKKKRLSSRVTRQILRRVVEPIAPRFTIPALLERFAPAGDVLDIGCGSGEVLEGIDGRFRPWGIEISTGLARRAREKFAAHGGDVVHAPALEGLRGLPARKFAAIVMRSYLEHEVSPCEVLAASFRATRPEGIIIIKVPNFGSINARLMGPRWCGVRLPGHVNYFRPRELEEMVTRVGYSVSRFHPFRYRLPTSDNMWLIGRRPAEQA